jgi:hypothetical protein
MMNVTLNFKQIQRNKMKKAFQRLLNLITVLTVAAAVISIVGKEGVLAMLWLGFGFFIVLTLNYVCFGKLGLWHKIEKDE